MGAVRIRRDNPLIVDDAFGHWLAGLIDGEGCFRVQRNGARRGARHATYVPVFGLKLRDDDASVLAQIAEQTGIGHLDRDIARTGGSKPCLRWTVDTRADCAQLVEILDRFPLRTRKAADYVIWRRAVVEWTTKPRGDRWHGPRDWSVLSALRDELVAARAYVPVGRG